MLTFGNKILTRNDGWIGQPIKPIPPNTIRLRYRAGTTPSFSKGTGVCIDYDNNIWDLTYNDSSWRYLLDGHTDLVEVIGGQTSNVTDTLDMFWYCTSLETVAVFDTSNVTNMGYMFERCTSLKHVPLFNTSSLTMMFGMFENCSNVESGMYDLYLQVSSQANVPSHNVYTFGGCGTNTASGRAARAQIPTTWGGDLEV